MIVIPMAGLSRRFAEAGYAVPKYMLEAHGKSLFRHAVESFAAYFEAQPFLFVCRDIAGAPDFVRSECDAMGIASAKVAVLPAPTSGQAETVALGLDEMAVPDDEPATIFNIDTFRPGLRLPTQGALKIAAGYLEVFRGDGANWSYARTETGDASSRVIETAEKRPISSFCCTGLYHFARSGDFRRAYAYPPPSTSAAEARETYVAPLYNRLIQWGMDIRISLIDRTQIIFCGIPEEYQQFIAGIPGPTN